ncbi:hypothetical protein [Pedobacter nototheniae]|uniref:hypothetical protein n=1 Tax=Pedobacter nototheniae TaxID=2488994 RepID=UPI00292D94E5|nr:hypothetical protein [Pedobacter nototheniae]
MASNFEHFFGYENQINKNPDLVLIYGFAGIIFGLMAMILIAVLLRKIGLPFLISKFLNPLILSLGICFLVAIIPTILFKVLANDLSGVKLIYIWIVIFAGITMFTTINYQMLKKWLYSFDRKS